MIMLIITVVINWLVIFAVANIFVDPGKALISSIIIVVILIALAVSPVAEYLVRAALGSRKATEGEADIFGPEFKRVWNGR